MKEPLITNLSGYLFVQLTDLDSIQQSLKACLTQCGVKGAVIVAPEGVNVTLAGTSEQASSAANILKSVPQFRTLWLKQTLSSSVPHRRLRVRIRNEIIAFDGPDSAQQQRLRPRAPNVDAHTLDSWLDGDDAITLLDTRNDYEIVSGTFRTAQHLNIKHFRHFKSAIMAAIDNGELDKSQPVVTFCTGGIRCEKAAPWLLSEGFEKVYQLEGGVLNYLKETNSEHWQGDCFVFDDRVELTPQLSPTGAGLCDRCQLAVPAGTECQCQLGVHHHASYS